MFLVIFIPWMDQGRSCRSFPDELATSLYFAARLMSPSGSLLRPNRNRPFSKLTMWPPFPARCAEQVVFRTKKENVETLHIQPTSIPTYKSTILFSMLSASKPQWWSFLLCFMKIPGNHRRRDPLVTSQPAQRRPGAHLLRARFPATSHKQAQALSKPRRCRPCWDPILVQKCA